ncbi:hypothetical protein [Paenibacillus sp. FSL W7-1332]|uniref:hypothetical protein n=1 Tax=Paenibacillus sp. FSL W7-1332 TaxID=2921702 RepID=UPI0030CD707F
MGVPCPVAVIRLLPSFAWSRRFQGPVTRAFSAFTALPQEGSVALKEGGYDIAGRNGEDSHERTIFLFARMFYHPFRL